MLQFAPELLAAAEELAITGHVSLLLKSANRGRGNALAKPQAAARGAS